MRTDAMTRRGVGEKTLSTPSTNVAEPDSKSPVPSGNEDGTSEGVNHDVITPLGLKKRWYRAGKYAPKIGRSNDLAAIRSLGQDPATNTKGKGICNPLTIPENSRGKPADTKGISQRFKVEFLE
jgi:hypothetical protein